jgi:NADPH:quinone reductase-like Zn-dependent oxidoreductase
MRALVFKHYGRPDQVTFADAPRPVPKPNEILVQVHAAGLNPIDNMILKGTFKPILRFQLPATLGSDLAGIRSCSCIQTVAYSQRSVSFSGRGASGR